MIKIKKKKYPVPGFWKDKSVLITGHTGFKGGWLSLWLGSMGAKVHGLALDPDTQPNLFSVADVKKFINLDMRVDIREKANVCKALNEAEPEIIFHVAAQPLVRKSYREPLYTFETNALGTAHVLEAVRNTSSVRVAVMITTDKVYENHEWPYPYREIDALGGGDPYSASKACAEIIIDSYRKSFLERQNISISSVRAGNVIGGGDWSEDRLIPDAMKAFTTGESLILRNPNSIRPWQHVLDPLCGYLLLAQAQWNEPKKYARAWNFAPDNCMESTVGEIADVLSYLWGDDAKVKVEKNQDTLYESILLGLDSSLAHMHLGWQSNWTLSDTLRYTVEWYKEYNNKKNMQQFTLNQIKEYMSIEESYD